MRCVPGAGAALDAEPKPCLRLLRGVGFVSQRRARSNLFELDLGDLVLGEAGLVGLEGRSVSIGDHSGATHTSRDSAFLGGSMDLPLEDTLLKLFSSSSPCAFSGDARSPALILLDDGWAGSLCKTLLPRNVSPQAPNNCPITERADRLGRADLQLSATSQYIASSTTDRRRYCTCSAICGTTTIVLLLVFWRPTTRRTVLPVLRRSPMQACCGRPISGCPSTITIWSPGLHSVRGT